MKVWLLVFMHFNITYQNTDGISIDFKFNLPPQKDFVQKTKKNNFIKCQSELHYLISIRIVTKGMVKH